MYVYMYGSTNGVLNNVTPFNYITFSACIEMTKLDGEKTNRSYMHHVMLTTKYPVWNIGMFLDQSIKV